VKNADEHDTFCLTYLLGLLLHLHPTHTIQPPEIPLHHVGWLISLIGGEKVQPHWGLELWIGTWEVGDGGGELWYHQLEMFKFKLRHTWHCWLWLNCEKSTELNFNLFHHLPILTPSLLQPQLAPLFCACLLYYEVCGLMLLNIIYDLTCPLAVTNFLTVGKSQPFRYVLMLGLCNTKLSNKEPLSCSLEWWHMSPMNIVNCNPSSIEPGMAGNHVH